MSLREKTKMSPMDKETTDRGRGENVQHVLQTAMKIPEASFLFYHYAMCVYLLCIINNSTPLLLEEEKF